MKTPQRSIVLLAMTLLALAASPIQANEIEFIEVTTSEDWNKVLNTAQEKGLSIFVDVYATWCGPCKMMDRDVYTNQAVASYYNTTFINAKMDGETNFGQQFAYQFGVEAYPTLMFMDGDANLITSTEGYHDSSNFIALGKDAENTATQLPLLKAKYDNGTLSPEEKGQYVALLANQDASAAEAMALELVENISANDMLNPSYQYVVTNYGTDIDGPIFAQISSHAQEAKEAWGQNGFEEYLGTIYNEVMYQAVTEEKPELVGQLIAKVIPLFLDDEEEIPGATYTTWKLYYGNIEGWAPYKDAIKEAFAEVEGTGEERGNWLYNEAYELVNDYSSEGAMGLAIEVLDQSGGIGVKDFEWYTLYAYALGVKGDLSGARVKAEKAAEVAAGADEKEMAQDLLNMIKEASQD